MLADFDKGGIENADNLDAKRALLREIVEEALCLGLHGSDAV